MTKYIYITSLALILAACSNSSDSKTDAPADTPSETAAEALPKSVIAEVESEPTGMNAGATEPVDMDYTRITFEKGAV